MASILRTELVGEKICDSNGCGQVMLTNCQRLDMYSKWERRH